MTVDDASRAGAANHFQLNARAKASAAWRARHPGLKAALNLRSHYGLAEDDWWQLLHDQCYVCPICSRLLMLGLPKCGASIAVDHDHETGTVRGLVHDRCNRFIALVENFGCSMTDYSLTPGDAP